MQVKEKPAAHPFCLPWQQHPANKNCCQAKAAKEGMCICKAGAGQALCEGETVRVGKTCVLLTLDLVCSVCFWTRECTGHLSVWVVFMWNSKWQSAVLSHMFPSMAAHREEVCAELLLTDVANPPAKVKICGTALLLHQLQLDAQSLFQQQALNNPEFQKLLNKLIFVKSNLFYNALSIFI